MAVDLSGLFVTSPLAALTGSSPAFSVSVLNTGTTKAGSPLVLAMYMAPDGTPFDINTATPLGRISRGASVAAGGVQEVDFSLKLSAALAAGDYRFYAVIDPDGKIVESDEANNTVTSGIMTVVQPNYDLVASFADSAKLVPSVVVNQKTNATLPVVITNSSGSTVSLPANISVAVVIVARPVGAPDASQDVVLNTKPVSVAVGGG